MELFSGKNKNLILDHLIENSSAGSDYWCRYCGAVLSENRGNILKHIAECGYEGCHCLRNVSGNHFR